MKTYYQANDGTCFDNMESCINYEKAYCKQNHLKFFDDSFEEIPKDELEYRSDEVFYIFYDSETALKYHIDHETTDKILKTYKIKHSEYNCIAYDISTESFVTIEELLSKISRERKKTMDIWEEFYED